MWDLMDKIISKIEIKDKKVLIEIDGEYHLFLYTRDLRKQKFKIIVVEGQALSDEDYAVLLNHVISRGKRRIMYLLGKQDYPKSKLEEKLAKNGYIDIHINEILKLFIDKGFVDDTKLVNRRVETFKGYKSKKEIEYKLRTGGFTSEDIKEAIHNQFSEEDELSSAIKLLNKRFMLKKIRLEENELKQKALGYLSRKGYPINICFKAFEVFITKDEE